MRYFNDTCKLVSAIGILSLMFFVLSLSADRTFGSSVMFIIGAFFLVQSVGIPAVLGFIELVELIPAGPFLQTVETVGRALLYAAAACTGFAASYGLVIGLAKALIWAL